MSKAISYTANKVLQENYNSKIISFPYCMQSNNKNKTEEAKSARRIYPHNKQKGKKSEVYHYEISDMKKITTYFANEEKWLHYLMFVLSCNMARRVGDMLLLKWENFFNPNTGDFRNDILEITEDKTDKLANPHINSACRAAINLYIEKTGCDVSKNNYKMPVFLQLTGNFKGKILSYSCCIKTLKEAAKKVGIKYNVGTHSARKTFGMTSRMLHPNDYDSMELLQTIYNHSDSKTTGRYIGLTKKKIDTYYDDMGNFFDDYIIGNKEYEEISDKPIVTLDTNDLRDIIRAAYEAGKNNATENDAMVHIYSISEIMQMVERLKK